jgi:5-methylcytosine-specific restriction protein A
MGKLSNLRPSISTLPSRIAFTQDAAAKDQRTIGPPAWKKWYSLKRWKDLRWSVLVRDLFTCAMCHTVQPDPSDLVADHIKAHRGNVLLFWDPKNLQTLCAWPCHNKHKQQEEASEPDGVWD